ncbi:TPA: hypothetical protein JA361_14975 [Legionella pneumophila]|nr:hypothetical protein [Legionella pneumophila]HAT8181147.1 hypothetical protein [Legionella pneumophila]
MKNKDKVKLSPVQGAGDCGYHVVILGLLYLTIKATEDQKIASMINSSDAISKLLAAQPITLTKYLIKPTNQECLLNYLDAMAASSFEQLTFNEILSNFTLQLKQIILDSDWLQDRIQNEIKSGLWLETHRTWEKLPSFKSIMKKIQFTADQLYEKATTEHPKMNDDLLFEIIFQAQIQACNALTNQELILAANEVISSFYAIDSPKAWLDHAFLKQLVTHLLGSPDCMFDINGVLITGGEPSNNHWYVELPNDTYTQKFISIYKMNHHTGLMIVVPETKIEVSISNHSSLFSLASPINKSHNSENSISKLSSY